MHDQVALQLNFLSFCNVSCGLAMSLAEPISMVKEPGVP